MIEEETEGSSGIQIVIFTSSSLIVTVMIVLYFYKRRRDKDKDMVQIMCESGVTPKDQSQEVV